MPKGKFQTISGEVVEEIMRLVKDPESRLSMLYNDLLNYLMSFFDISYEEVVKVMDYNVEKKYLKIPVMTLLGDLGCLYTNEIHNMDNDQIKLSELFKGGFKYVLIYQIQMDDGEMPWLHEQPVFWKILYRNPICKKWVYFMGECEATPGFYDNVRLYYSYDFKKIWTIAMDESSRKILEEKGIYYNIPEEWEEDYIYLQDEELSDYESCDSD